MSELSGFEIDGEESLIEKNDLPKVALYKAGHHGSKTSSSAALLEVIKPDMVCVCCCAGSPRRGLCTATGM